MTLGWKRESLMTKIHFGFQNIPRPTVLQIRTRVRRGRPPGCKLSCGTHFQGHLTASTCHAPGTSQLYPRPSPVSCGQWGWIPCLSALGCDTKLSWTESHKVLSWYFREKHKTVRTIMLPNTADGDVTGWHWLLHFTGKVIPFGSYL